MALYGRRRIIVSGSNADNITNMLNTYSTYSASFHSTSSIDDNLFYYDFDCQDIDHLASLSKYINEQSTYYKDYGWAVVPNYPTGSSDPNDTLLQTLGLV